MSLQHPLSKYGRSLFVGAIVVKRNTKNAKGSMSNIVRTEDNGEENCL